MQSGQLTPRIVYVIGQLHAGGSERQLFYLLREMDRCRYRPAVVVWNASEAEVYFGEIRRLDIPIYGFPGRLPAGAKLMNLRRLVKRLAPEIVHSFSFYLNVAAQWSVRGTRAIAFGSVRSALDLDKQVNGWLVGKLSARWPRTQIYNSYEAARCADSSSGPFVPGRRIVVQNGVDLDGFRGVPLEPRQRPRVVGVGSLVPVKRWDRLLNAAAELKRRGLDCSVQIAGDGPLLNSLQMDVNRLGVADRVVFTGYSDQVSRLIAEATFLVHCSDAEGCPNVLLEAMACGRAVVATGVGDACSLVEDGKTGFLVARGDDRAIVERMYLLMTDYRLCKRMGEAGRAKAEREFSLDRMVSHTFAAYQATGWANA